MVNVVSETVYGPAWAPLVYKAVRASSGVYCSPLGRLAFLVHSDGCVMGPGEDHHPLLGVVNHFPRANQRACSIATYPTVRDRRPDGTSPADLCCGHSVSLYRVIDKESLARKVRAAVC